MNIREYWEKESSKPRWIDSMYDSRCRMCGKAIKPGDMMLWVPILRNPYCQQCGPEVKKSLES